jgi:hypothetical protein
MKDASQNSTIASSLINPNNRNEFIKELNARYNYLREGRNETQPIKLNDARNNKIKLY